jgi:hypothetical protein
LRPAGLYSIRQNPLRNEAGNRTKVHAKGGLHHVQPPPPQAFAACGHDRFRHEHHAGSQPVGLGGDRRKKRAGTEDDLADFGVLAYLQAYTDLVGQFKNLPESASAANESQAVTMAKPGRMYATSSTKSKVVRALDPGMMLYPTGAKAEAMWEVEDELGNKGWVSSMLFQLAK